MPSEEFFPNLPLATDHSPLSSTGRWLSPDPLAGDVTNPQSLNRYAYVLNNPTNFVDPSGLCPEDQICRSPIQAQGIDSGGLGCEVNGIGSWCGITNAVLAAGTAIGMICPQEGCSGIRVSQGAGGSTQVQQWVPGGQASDVLKDENGNVIGTGTGPYLPAHWTTVEIVTYDSPSDYLQGTLNVGFLFGVTATLTVDKYGRGYMGVGGNIGKSATLVSGSFQGGHVLVSAPATPGAVYNALTGAGCSAGGGFLWGGFGYFNLFKPGTAYTVGGSTPQFGISCTVSGRIF